MPILGHPSTSSGLNQQIVLTHTRVYFIECASQKTQKYSVNRQYWQLTYSQENLGTLTSGLIFYSKLILRAILKALPICCVIPFYDKNILGLSIIRHHMH